MVWGYCCSGSNANKQVLEGGVGRAGKICCLAAQYSPIANWYLLQASFKWYGYFWELLNKFSFGGGCLNVMWVLWFSVFKAQSKLLTPSPCSSHIHRALMPLSALLQKCKMAFFQSEQSSPTHTQLSSKADWQGLPWLAGCCPNPITQVRKGEDKKFSPVHDFKYICLLLPQVSGTVPL